MFVRKACLLLWLLVVAVAAVSADEDYTVVQTLFLPPTFYVGDQVELRIRIKVGEGVVPAEPSELPAPTWIHVQDVRVIPISGDYDIRITFSTYEPGLGKLPPIEMGDVVLSGIDIETASMIGDDVIRIEEAYDPVLLPGSRLLLALGIGALLVLPIAGLALTVWLRKLMANILERRRRRRPLKDLNQILGELGGLPSPVNNREFYIRLFDGFRAYLSTKLGWSFASLTALETQRVLRERFPEIAAMNSIASELPRFDTVKFGGGRVSTAKRSRDLAAVREAAAGLEQYVDEREERRKKRGGQHVDV